MLCLRLASAYAKDAEGRILSKPTYLGGTNTHNDPYNDK